MCVCVCVCACVYVCDANHIVYIYETKKRKSKQ